MEAHGGFPGYYPVVSTLVFYPWSALVPAAIAGAWVRRKANPDLELPARMDRRPAHLARMLPDQVDPLLPPGVPGVRAPVGLARPGDRRAGASTSDDSHSAGWAWHSWSGSDWRMAAILLAGSAAGAEPLRWPMVDDRRAAGRRDLRAACSSFNAGRPYASRAVPRPDAGPWSSSCWPAGSSPRASPTGRRGSSANAWPALSSRMGIEPVLLEYQEPGVIYALGHPAAADAGPRRFLRPSGGRPIRR